MSSWHRLGSQRRRTLNRQMFPWIGLWPSVWGIPLIDDRWGKSLPTADDATPEEVTRGCIRKQVEQAMENKPWSSTMQWSLLYLLLQVPILSEFLPDSHQWWTTTSRVVRWNKPFPPKAALAMLLSYSNRNPKKYRAMSKKKLKYNWN